MLALFLVISMFTAGFGLRATGSATIDNANAFPDIDAEAITDPSLKYLKMQK